MDDYKDSWKNEEVFKKQLALNTQELHTMPDHWKIFLSMLGRIKEDQDISTLLDVGCGCGAFAELIKMYYPSISYTGMDYAEEAIKLASREWPHAQFIQKNYTELTKEDVKDYDIVSSCGLHQMLPDGDKAMEHFLKLDANILIFLKLNLTDNANYFSVYEAYNEIHTYKFFHNHKDLLEMFKKYGYYSEEIKQAHYTSHFLLRKQ